MTVTVLHGDVFDRLRSMLAGSVQCIVTSPPYYGLRDYGVPPSSWGGDPECEHSWSTEASCDRCSAWRGCLGLEPDYRLYVEHIVAVFRELWRVLRDDGTAWLNIGDSYAGGGNGGGGSFAIDGVRGARRHADKNVAGRPGRRGVEGNIKPKDLMGIPWRVAFALQDDGWYLRRDVIWDKPSCMPESVTDRPTTAHEYVFLLTKRERYFYDAQAIAEPLAESSIGRLSQDVASQAGTARANGGRKINGPLRAVGYATRNARSVWTIGPEPFKGSHFATMPTALAGRCVLAGTSEIGCCPACRAPWERITIKGEADRAAQRAAGADRSGGYSGQSTKGHDNVGVQNASDVKRRVLEGMREVITVAWRMTCDCQITRPVPCTVLDPFGGSGTTGVVADRLRRDVVLIELNAEYVGMIKDRLHGDAGMFAEVAAE